MVACHTSTPEHFGRLSQVRRPLFAVSVFIAEPARRKGLRGLAVAGSKGSRVKSPRGSRHCVPAIVPPSSPQLERSLNRAVGEGKRGRRVRAGSQETLPAEKAVDGKP